MNNNDLLTNQEKLLYSEDISSMIHDFCNKMIKLEKFLSDNNFIFCPPCKNNIRDTWFHYKKMYDSVREAKILEEKNAIEEHMNRALIDAMVFFYQSFINGFRYIYTATKEDFNDFYKENSDFIENFLMEENFEQNQKLNENWVSNLYKKVSEYEETDIFFANTIVSIYFYYIKNDETSNNLQSILHEIKNQLWNVRSKGVNIERDMNNRGVDKIQIFIDDTQAIINKMNEMNLKNCVSSIYTAICDYVN